MIGFSAFTTVAARHGYGRDDLNADEEVSAAYYRMTAQSFSLIATGTSKASVGFFLLRLTAIQWQIISIWVIMIVMGIMAICMFPFHPILLLSRQPNPFRQNAYH